MMLKPKYGCLILLLLFSLQKVNAQDTTYTDVKDSIRIDTVSAEKRGPQLDSNIAVPTVDIRSVPDSAIKRLKQDDDFWYVNTVPPREKQKALSESPISFLFSKWFTTLLWIIISLCFVAALVWFLSSGSIRLFRKKAIADKSEDDASIREDIFSIDYAHDIQAALAAENYVLAIRLHYLESLFLLAQRELIRYKPEKTNSDLASQLWQTDYYKDFARLTRHFEYISYGHFQLNKDDYDRLAIEFDQFKDRIPS